MAVPVGDWLTITNQEYLRRFVSDRGCAVKFVNASGESLSKVSGILESLSKERLLPVVNLDAATTRLHMLQDVFFAIARETDWDRLAQRWIEAVFKQAGYKWPQPGQPVPLSALAETWNVNPVLLKNELMRLLNRHLMNQKELTQDFRAAMANLCMRRLEPEDEHVVAPVLEWLRGELRTIGAVRHVPINGKITRHNARAMLRSLCHWLRLVGGRGFVATLDLRQVSRSDFAGGLKYTPAAAMDVFEVLRQLIDETESFEGFLLVVIVDDAFMEPGARRGLDGYLALKQRIQADVQAHGHENPLAPLLQLVDDDSSGARRLPSGSALAEMPYNEARVAIETLRFGVPNRIAVRKLGTSETALAERFRVDLRALRSSLSSRDVRPREVIAGRFGSGKSHLLGFLGDLALQEEYVVSKVAISKETSLFDTERVYAAAIRNAEVASANDDIMALALQRLRPESAAFRQLETWASEPASGLSPIFAAILHLWPRHAALGPEDRRAIIRFLSGAKLGVSRVRQWLRSAGGAGLVRLYDLKTVKAGELAVQRLKFAPALFRAAGFSGWCVLLDEVELIGRYTRLQRGRSYVELARWLGLSDDVFVPGLVSVCCVIQGFDGIMNAMRGGPDEEQIPLLLSEKFGSAPAQLATSAMHALANAHHLADPTSEAVERSLDRLRDLYRESYGGPLPARVTSRITSSDSIRYHIKAAITQWDIKRLYGVDAETEAKPIEPPPYEEDAALEHAPPGEAVEDEIA